MPYLVHRDPRDDSHFGILVVSDVFALTDPERLFLSERLAAKKIYKGRAGDKRLLDAAATLDLPAGGFDVVLGNPPWQEAAQESLPLLWAAAFNFPIGDGFYSQLFLHRAFAMLREGGALGMLIGMKVFWNDRESSRTFRKYLLAHATITEVVNMAHVRRVFFAKAVAPFAFLLAQKKGVYAFCKHDKTCHKDRARSCPDVVSVPPRVSR